MEHCRKLVLLSQDELAKMKDKPILRTTGEVMSALDEDMGKILKQKAEDSYKWKMYEQTLQRYLHFADEQRKPLEMTMPEAAPENEDFVGSNQSNNACKTTKQRQYAVSLGRVTTSSRCYHLGRETSTQHQERGGKKYEYCRSCL